MHLSLGFGSFVPVERVIACLLPTLDEAAGKITPIIGIISSSHGDLVSGIDQRSASNRQQDRERQLHLPDRSPLFSQKALRIMAADQSNQTFRSRINGVLT